MSEDKIGATGRFPDGKLGPDDEGELAMRIGATKDGLVWIDLGKPVAWIGMPPQEAADFASLILQHARKAARAKGVMIEVKL